VNGVLVHSPLVGPATTQPLADALRTLGWSCVAADLRPALTGPRPYWRTIANIAAAASADVDMVLGHSGAGAMLPVITDRIGARTMIFVDALVPEFADWYTPSTEFIALIDRVTDDELLSPWHEWWPPDTMAELVPDPKLRRRIIEETPRLPRSFYDESVPLPSGWRSRTCGYVQLSPAYDEDRQRAERYGWPVRRLQGQHLDIAVRAEAVAQQVVDLIRDV
jgi:hypothetical protein